MIVGVPRESCPGERRVAMVPAIVPMLLSAESGAGAAACIPDAAFEEKGARIVTARDEVYAPRS